MLATTVNAVSRLGSSKNIVFVIAMNLNPSAMPGSRYWWWIPTGVDRIRNNTKTTRASGSLNSLPPESFGSMVYHSMYAGISQKYTTGWPKNQNSVRVSSGLTESMIPSDHGSRNARIEMATPIELRYQNSIVVNAMNVGSGIRSSGLSFFQAHHVRNQSKPASQVPTTNRTKPT